MIIINGVDGSGKTTVAGLLQKKLQGSYLHYYSIFPTKQIKDEVRTIAKKESRQKSNFYFSFFKEFIFATYKLIFFIFYHSKSKIIIDRTFLDVFVDLRERFGNMMLLKIFLVYENFFRYIKSNNISTYLYVDSFKIILQRKFDEDEKSAQKKYIMYKELEGYFQKSFKFNTSRESPATVANNIYEKIC